MFSWDDLKYFLAMTEEGSLSAAARKLNVSQPTLSRRLNALEEDVGSELFSRTRTGLEVTALGEQLITHALHMRDDVHAVERLITGHDSRLKGSVIVSCTETLGADWLIKNTLPFHKQYPGITVEVNVANQTSDLVRREADIALRMFRPVQNELVARKTVNVNYGYYATKDYLERMGTPKNLKDLKDHAFIMPHDDILAHTTGRRKARTVQNEPAFRSNSLQSLEAAVKYGFGIGGYSCINAHNDPNLVRLFDDYLVFSAELWLVSHTELKRSARIRAMYDYLGDTLMANKAAFEGTAA